MVWWGLSLPPSSPAPPLLGYIWLRIGSRRCQHPLRQLMGESSAKPREKCAVSMSLGYRRAGVTVHLDQPRYSGSSNPMILLSSASSAASDQGAGQTSTGPISKITPATYANGPSRTPRLRRHGRGTWKGSREVMAARLESLVPVESRSAGPMDESQPDLQKDGGIPVTGLESLVRLGWRRFAGR